MWATVIVGYHLCSCITDGLFLLHAQLLHQPCMRWLCLTAPARARTCCKSRRAQGKKPEDYSGRGSVCFAWQAEGKNYFPFGDRCHVVPCHMSCLAHLCLGGGTGDEAWTPLASVNPGAVRDRQRHLSILPSGGRGVAWDDFKRHWIRFLRPVLSSSAQTFAESGMPGIIPLLVLRSMPTALDVDC